MERGDGPRRFVGEAFRGAGPDDDSQLPGTVMID